MSTTLTETPAVTTPTIADVFERAAWYIEEFGHCKAAFALGPDELPTYETNSEAVAFCMAGATGRALVDLNLIPEDCDVGETGNGFLWEHAVFNDENEGTNWNDQPERTPEEVIQALRQAAARAREAA